MAERDLLADLNPAQREAVTHINGPLLILAAAGSGKTRVITRRVAYLLDQGIPAHNILAITFTNKAAGVMKERIEALVPGNRVWVSTFHSLGARLLREYADVLGLERGFTIYDQSDRLTIVKKALEDVSLGNAKLTPEGVMGAISKAKNQLLSPERYREQANDFLSKLIARIYPVYEKRLRESRALDFDDLLYWPALGLKNNAEWRARLDARFKYVLIDEYQDTNHAQYQFARLLAIDYPNLCVVGDPNQCLPPGTLVETPGGRRPIETISEGDRVTSACGWGDVTGMPVNKVMCKPYRGKLVVLRTEGGHVVRATPNHICFARLLPTAATHFVYLMFKQGVGYRVGTTRGVRTNTQGDLASGLQVRANQEVADAMWIIRTCRTAAEARFYEQFLSVTYGLPTWRFHVRGRRMEVTQELVDRLYREVDTEGGAARLMADFHLDRRYPHHRPGGVTRGTWGRRNVLFTLFGDSRKSLMCSWRYHRVQMVTSGDDARTAAAERFKVRSGSKGTRRIETSRKHHDEALALAQEIGVFHETEVHHRARLTASATYVFMPAGHIHPGMLVPVLEGNQVVGRLVESVDWEDYDGPVYDLSVPETHNFVAGGLVVHNSIYKFRGSDIRNILSFESDFPNARVLQLGMNYRSTKAILQVASKVIANNKQRKHLDLLTNNPEGQRVRVLVHANGEAEADNIARRIREDVQAGKRNYFDFAVLVRMNALTRALEKAFLGLQVPFQIVKGLAFFDRKENRDILAYLRLLLNPHDNVSFERIVNVPPRGLGAKSLEELGKYAEANGLSLLAAAGRAEFIQALQARAAVAFSNFAAMMRELTGLLESPPDEVIRQVLARSGYEKMLTDSKEPDDHARLENIQEMITAAQQFAKESDRPTIEAFLEGATLSGETDGYNEKQNCVSMMTLHAAKGLEFPVVYIAACEHGILPHQRAVEEYERSKKPDEIEEERRLAFVGMTRAMHELNLSRVQIREFRGQLLNAIASMFLDEIPPHLLELVDMAPPVAGAADRIRRGVNPVAREAWVDTGIDVDDIPLPSPPKQRGDDKYQIGMVVRHKEYGEGKVAALDGAGATRNVHVRFRTAGMKTFRASHAQLEVVQ